MADGFDKTKFSLKANRLRERSRIHLYFACRRAPDFAPLRSMIEPYFTPHRLSEAKLAYEHTIIEKGNWKLVWENNRECYHCSVNHPELCRTFPGSADGHWRRRRGK
jgi:Rieske 2Fe-2S family protein